MNVQHENAANRRILLSTLGSIYESFDTCFVYRLMFDMPEFGIYESGRLWL